MRLSAKYEHHCSAKQSSVFFKNMKFLIALTIFVAVTADVSHLSNQYLAPVGPSSNFGYLPPAPPAPSYIPALIPPAPAAPAYIPPAPQAPTYIPPAPPAPAYLSPEKVAPDYLPPQQIPQCLLPAKPAPNYETSNDGYKYRTVKRIKYRYRA